MTHPDNFGKQFDDIIGRNFSGKEPVDPSHAQGVMDDLYRVNNLPPNRSIEEYKDALPCRFCGEPVTVPEWHKQSGNCDNCNVQVTEHKQNAANLFGRNVTEYKNAMPCKTCGEPVDTDVWHEEMGYCIDCQHNAFDHSDEEK